MNLWLVDAHCTYQAGLNVPSLAREGYDALVVKATQGTTSYTAPALFDTWRAQARNSGLMFGAYHWVNDTNPVQQVAHFLDRIGDPAGMLIQLDCEDNASWATLQGWFTEWNRRTNRHPVILYTGAWWWNVVGRRWNGASLTPYLWHSHYVMDGANPAAGFASAIYPRVSTSWWQPGYGGWSEATVLQFTSRGTTAGLNANVDLNAFQGVRDDLVALTQSGVMMDDATLRHFRQNTNVESMFDALLGCFDRPADTDNQNGITTVLTEKTNVLGTSVLETLRLVQNLVAAGTSPTLTDAQIAQLRTGLAAEVAGLLAPQFKDVADIRRALGDAGDAEVSAAQALGKLNDA